MIIAYLKWKNTPRQARVIALTIVGGVFLILFFISIWQQYFANNLIRYAPSDSVFYTYFSLPKIKRSVQFENLLHQAIFDGAQKTSFGLTDLPIEYIDRELAVIAFPLDNQLVYGVLFRTNQAARINSIFETKKVIYHSFNNRTFLVVASEDVKDHILSRLEKKDSFKRVKKGFNNFNSLSLYINHDFLSYNNNLLFNFFYDALKNEDGEVFMNVKVGSRAKVKILSKNISQSINLIADSQSDYDLVATFNNPSQLIANWETKLAELSLVDHSIWYDYFKSRTDLELINNILTEGNKISFILKQNDISGYDFCLSVATDQVQSLEDNITNLFKITLAKEFPKTKIRYLSDGSRVSELVVDPDQFKFIDDGEIKMVKSPDGSKIIMYVVRDGVVILGNNKQMIDEASDNVSDDNSLIISSELLLNSEFGGYLKHFNFVEVN